MIKAIIFDQDGTIIDSATMTMKRHELTAEKMGIPMFDHKAYMGYSGQGWHHILKMLWPDVDPEEFIRVYKTINLGKYPAIEGSVATVKKLKEKYLLGIVTGTPSKRAFEKLTDAGFDPDWFEFVHGEEDLVECKPSGKAFEKGLDVLGLSPEEVVYVGDSDNDYAAATAANISFIGVLTGYGTPEDFHGAPVINSVVNLPEVLK